MVHCLTKIVQQNTPPDVYKRQVVRYADELDIAVNVYLEDWSNGMKAVSYTHLVKSTSNRRVK